MDSIQITNSLLIKKSKSIEALHWPLWLAVFIVSLIKMRAYIPHGRFWAEEGKYFFGDIGALESWQGLFYLFNNHLEFATNIVVWCSTLVDLYHAPKITTFLSWLIQLIPIGLVIHFREQLKLSFYRTLFFVLAASAIPQSSEVWANSINLHFHFALVAAIIAIISILSSPQKWLFRVLLIFAGLSGIPANSLLPIFILIALRSNDKEKWVHVGILTSTTLLQLGLLLTKGLPLEDRSTTTDPLVAWLALVAQHIVAPIFGKTIGKHLIHSLNVLANPGTVAWILVVSISLGYALLWLSVLRRKLESSIYCLLSGLLLALFCILTSLGERKNLISLSGGGRYFFAPNLLLILAILLWIPKKTKRVHIGLLLIWTLLLLKGVRSYTPGEPWPAAYSKSKTLQTEHIEIWPHGWRMQTPTTSP